MKSVEVLFNDPRSAVQARDALLASSVGQSARQALVVEDVATYDRLNRSMGHSLAFAGAVLGAMLAMLRVGFVLAVAAVLFADVDLVTVYWGSMAAFSYGALVGLLAGSQVLALGPRMLRRELARGKALVRVVLGDLTSAMLAHDLLARQPGAERSYAD